MTTAAAAKPKVAAETLTVRLDTSKDPAVRISDRNKKAKSGAKITWRKKKDSAEFEFSDFQPDDKEFKKVKVAGGKIECKFETKKAGGTKHPYTILVKSGKKTYSSDKKKDVKEPDEGRAVIRN